MTYYEKQTTMPSFLRKAPLNPPEGGKTPPLLEGVGGRLKPTTTPSFLRRQESPETMNAFKWGIPACAGMTVVGMGMTVEINHSSNKYFKKNHSFCILYYKKCNLCRT
jgi:hypothetical protein